MHIYALPIWVIFVITLAMFVATLEACRWLSVRRRPDKGEVEGLGTPQAAMLGLLGPVLAFT